MKLKVPTSLLSLCRSVKTPIWIVGGYTRNHFAGLGETDIDLAGPIVATALGIEPAYRVRMVNYRLGTALIKCGRDEYEYTPFRTENYAPGGEHRPESVYFTTEIRLDAARRDFTCNSIYYNPMTARAVRSVQRHFGHRERHPARAQSRKGVCLRRAAHSAAGASGVRAGLQDRRGDGQGGHGQGRVLKGHHAGKKTRGAQPYPRRRHQVRRAERALPRLQTA